FAVHLISKGVDMKNCNNIIDDDIPSSITNNGESKKLPQNRIRRHTVTVRLKDIELERVNIMRNQLSKSCWLRSSALQLLPPTVPEPINEAWQELTHSLQNLNDL
ncbi:hypothetical protein, partial [Erwinia amylovora]|uniref:hypothetical protein n=1 Tax=Erwinia amylovora TaxID=552 RepID=UPI0020C03143